MPQIRRQADALHELGVFVNNTSDGDLWPIIDDFLIGTHVDGYGEIDKAAGMDLKRLKQRYGDSIVFGVANTFGLYNCKDGLFKDGIKRIGQNLISIGGDDIYLAIKSENG